MNNNILGLSNFYEDRSPKGRDYNKLALLYRNLYEMLTSYVSAVGRNAVIPMLETYKKIPAFNFDPLPAQYHLHEILSRPDVASKLGSNTMTETTSSRVAKWTGTGSEKYSVALKIGVLDYLGLYCNIYAYDVGMATTYKIIDATLFSYNFQKFSKGVDYVFQDNRLYLFNEASVPSSRTKYFVLENIFIDKMNIERRLGIYVGLEQPEDMTRNEYRELVQLIYYVVTMGSTIKNIETAIRSITGLEEAKVLDRFSEDTSRQAYWTDTSLGNRLKNFDFLISIPEMDQHDIQKLMNFIRYVKMIKPADTDFIFARAVSAYDVLHMTKRDAKTRFHVRSYVKDKIPYMDTMDFDQKTVWFEYIVATETVIANTVFTRTVDRSIHKDSLEKIPVVIRPNNFIVTDLPALYNEIRQGRYPTDQLTSDDLPIGEVSVAALDHQEYQGQMNKFVFDYQHANGDFLEYDSINIAWDGEDNFNNLVPSYKDIVEVKLIKN